MKPKLILTLSLGLFVVATVVYLVAGRSDGTPSTRTARAEGSAPGEQIVVYYFHRTRRCPGCRNLERVAHAAIASSYPKELKAGRVRIEALNVEDGANEEFVTRYSVFGSSLVLSAQVDGKEKAFKSLKQAWGLMRDQERFTTYIRGEIDALLAELGKPKGT